MTDASQADAAARRRDRVIKALLAKTVARGATPGEEAAAAEKARELAQRYRANDKARVAASLDRFLRGRGRHGSRPPIGA